MRRNLEEVCLHLRDGVVVETDGDDWDILPGGDGGAKHKRKAQHQCH